MTTLDLATATRPTRDPAALCEAHWIVGVRGRGGLVACEKTGGLANLAGARAEALGARCDAREREAAGTLWWLGATEMGDVYALALDDEAAAWEGITWVSLRAATGLTDTHATWAFHALALAGWWARAAYCARCGHPTRPTQAGWSQRCTHCGVDEYPRIDPSIIVAITDATDRLLLAHNRAWAPRSRSLIAGFVEAGESAEAAVVREVAEETGLALADITYVRSQPWPYPRSLMLAFWARHAGGELTFGSNEVDDGAFYTREEYVAACASGALTPPAPRSVAAALIGEWLGCAIPRPAREAAW